METDDIVTPIKIDVLEKFLKTEGYDPEKTSYLIWGFTLGFDIGYRGPLERQNYADNFPIKKGVGSETVMWNKLMEEIALQRIAGPFPCIPFKSFIQSPIGLVPKAGNKVRLILHLSFDFSRGDSALFNAQSFNHYTDPELRTVKYRDLDYAIQTCMRLIEELEDSEDSAGLFFTKTDLQSAFRLLPAIPWQRKFLIMKARNPITNNTFFFVDKCLPFGAHSSCKLFQEFSDALQFLVERHANKSFRVTNYLDDSLFVETNEENCLNLVSTFLNLCKLINCPVAQEKTEGPVQRIIFLGILLDGRNYTLSVPDDKRVAALGLLDTAINSKKAKVIFIQKLAGTLNFLSKAIVPGRTFTRRVYDNIKLTNKHGKTLSNHHHVQISAGFRRDCRVWRAFLYHITDEVVGLCRPFIDIKKSVDARSLNFFTDSSHNAKLGFGGLFNNNWFVGQWGETFINEQQLSIAYLELFALTTGILLWGDKLKNARYIIYCDNESVVNMVNNLTSKCSQCMKLIRLIMYNSLIHNRRLWVQHVVSEANQLADALPRLKFQKFWSLVPPTMSKKPEILPESIWPVEKLWFQD